MPTNIAEKKDYVDIALAQLAAAKGIDMQLYSHYIDGNGFFHGRMCGDADFDFAVRPLIFTDDSDRFDEPCYADWAFEKRLVIRLARIFYDKYNEWLKEKASQASAYQDVTASVSQQVINKIHIGQAVYDICDSRVDSISTTVNAAEQKLQELEDKNNKLEEELRTLRDFILQTMQKKGLI